MARSGVLGNGKRLATHFPALPAPRFTPVQKLVRMSACHTQTPPAPGTKPQTLSTPQTVAIWPTILGGHRRLIEKAHRPSVADIANSCAELSSIFICARENAPNF